jgi:hypothetical protein
MTFLTSFGMLLFARDVYGRDPRLQESWLPLLSSLIYTFNSYFLYWVIQDFMYVWFLMIGLPFLMWFLYRSFTARDKHQSIAYLAAAALTLFVMLPSFSWVWLLPGSFVVLSYIVALAAGTRRIRWAIVALVFLASELLLFLLYDLPWIMSTGSQLLTPDTTSVIEGWLLGNSKSMTVLTALADAKSGYPLNSIMFWIPLPILSALVILRRTSDRLLRALEFYALALVVIFVPLLMGASGPFGSVFLYVWVHSVIFRPFMTLLMDFGFVLPLAYSLLAPIGLLWMLDRAGLRMTHRWLAVSTSVIIILSAVVGSAPGLFTGSWATHYAPGWEPGARIEVPTSFEGNLSAFLSSNLHVGQRVLTLPVQGPLVGTTKYFGTDILARSGIPIFSGTYMPGPDDHVYIGIADQIRSGNTSHLADELAALGVKYVKVDLYYDPHSSLSGWYSTNITQVIAALNATPGLVYIGEIDNQLVYHVNYTYPLIYAARIPTDISNTTAYRFPSELPSISTSVRLKYHEVSPVEYVVDVNASQSPFILVFGETYDSGWKLLYGEHKLEPHYLVYGFANGWLVNITGDLKLVILYVPQRWWEIGLISTIIALLLPLTLLACILVFGRHGASGARSDTELQSS